MENYNEWANELQTILIRTYGFTFNSAKSMDQEAWKGYFEGGYSPREAIEEDYSDAGN